MRLSPYRPSPQHAPAEQPSPSCAAGRDPRSADPARGCSAPPTSARPPSGPGEVPFPKNMTGADSDSHRGQGVKRAPRLPVKNSIPRVTFLLHPGPLCTASSAALAAERCSSQGFPSSSPDTPPAAAAQRRPSLSSRHAEEKLSKGTAGHPTLLRRIPGHHRNFSGLPEPGA